MSRVIEAAVLKTVAAFLNNREGGTLLVGVADDGTALGLEPDYLTLRKEGKVDADLFQLALTQVVLNAVGAAAATNVNHADPHNRRPRPLPCTLSHAAIPCMPRSPSSTSKASSAKKRIFYVRMNNGTRAIDNEAGVGECMAGRWGRT